MIMAASHSNVITNSNNSKKINNNNNNNDDEICDNWEQIDDCVSDIFFCNYFCL
jgi:hypothetical protein